MSTIQSHTFDAGAESWVNNANATVAQSTTTPRTGAGCLLMTATSTSSASARGPLFPATAGVAYHAKLYWRPEVTVRDFQAYFQWFTSTGTFVSDSTSSFTTRVYAAGLPINTYSFLEFTATCPSGATQGRGLIQIINPATNDRGRMDDWIVTDPDPVTTTFGDVRVRYGGSLVPAQSRFRYDGTLHPAP